MTLLKLDSESAETIADVQASPDLRQLPIQMVGIKDIRHPIRVKDRSQGEQHTIAQFNMYVELPHDFKGTHMSRFVEILNNYEPEISVQSFKKMLKEMATRLVEDMVRDVASLLNADDRIDAYVVESENFESIHNHSAYAMIERDKQNDVAE